MFVRFKCPHTSISWVCVYLCVRVCGGKGGGVKDKGVSGHFLVKLIWQSRELQVWIKLREEKKLRYLKLNNISPQWFKLLECSLLWSCSQENEEDICMWWNNDHHHSHWEPKGCSGWSTDAGELSLCVQRFLQDLCY